MAELRYDGRVAIVTGAGGGLGRTYALLLGSRGAKVVVNDLGGSVKGDGPGDSRAADMVVDEIRKLGGEAVASYDSVTDGEKIVETAVKAFGRVDILINNAGVLRDVGFARMKDADWDIVHNVHLRGVYKITQAAWKEMIKNKYGRVVMTASSAGYYGNHGQGNYSAAKLGQAGLGLALSKEGASKGINVNIIAPVAGSRMTATVMPKEQLDMLKPEYITPFVGYLVHESCETNGGIFELAAGWYSQMRWQRSAGLFLNPAGKITPEHIKAGWADVSSFEKDATYPASTSDAFGPIMDNMAKWSKL